MNKNLVSLVCYILFFYGCTIFKGQKFYHKESQKILECRANWTYSSIENELEMEVLFFVGKSFGTTISHPNFFIGKTIQNDTIGVIDYFSDIKFSKGNSVKFINDINLHKTLESSNMSNKPIFYVSKRKIDSKLQCAVTNVYYGTVNDL